MCSPRVWLICGGASRGSVSVCSSPPCTVEQEEPDDPRADKWTGSDTMKLVRGCPRRPAPRASSDDVFPRRRHPAERPSGSAGGPSVPGGRARGDSVAHFSIPEIDAHPLLTARRHPERPASKGTSLSQGSGEMQRGKKSPSQVATARIPKRKSGSGERLFSFRCRQAL